MPWTRRQVRYLLSKGSPLSSEQESKMKKELHNNPAMGHKKKGSKTDHKPAKGDTHAFTYGRKSK